MRPPSQAKRSSAEPAPYAYSQGCSENRCAASAPQAAKRATWSFTSVPGQVRNSSTSAPLSRAERAVRRVEGRQQRAEVVLLVGRQHAAADVVVPVRTARVHHQRAVFGERVLQREVDLVGPAHDAADRAHRRVQEDHVARPHSERPEAVRQVRAGAHAQGLRRTLRMTTGGVRAW